MSFLVVGAVLLNVYALALILLRAAVYRTPLYRPMLWNVFLSILPILILGIGGLGGLMLRMVSPVAGGLALAATAVVWILILPNASYLITELNQSHRRDEDPVPLWYDIVLVITLAMSGVVNTVVNVFLAHLVFTTTVYGDSARMLLHPAPLAAVGAVMLLLGLGMYLGRYLRLNSWDLRHPVAFAGKIVAHFRAPGNALACFGFTVTYALFLCLIYAVVVGPLIEGLVIVEDSRIALLP